MSELNQDIKLKPVYDAEGGFQGWNVIYLAEAPGLFSPVARSRFFQEVIPGDSYLAACKFRDGLKATNENTK